MAQVKFVEGSLLSLQIFKSLPSTIFTWSILEYFLPIESQLNEM